MDHLTHVDESGKAVMVDVTQKDSSVRSAAAAGSIKVSPAVFEVIKSNAASKGDVLGVARVAGIMAAKRTSELIPLCHPLMLTDIAVDFQLHPDTYTIEVRCTAGLCGKTGVEMESLTGASIALLTIYDMCKAMDKNMIITGIHLAEKSGGKSGHYLHPVTDMN